jgi:hypothetical protein
VFVILAVRHKQGVVFRKLEILQGCIFLVIINNPYYMACTSIYACLLTPANSGGTADKVFASFISANGYLALKSF